MKIIYTLHSDMDMENYNKGVYADDFGKICRICLLPDTSLQLISQELLNLFRTITNIQYRMDDNLPQNICQKCAKKLEDIGEFIDKSKDHHSLLLLALERKSNAFFLTDMPDDSCGSDNAMELSKPIKSEYEGNHSLEPNHRHTKLTCAECGSKFSLKKYLSRHINWHCKALKYSCGLCRLKCRSEKALQRHSRIKHKVINRSKFSCGKCDRVLTSIGSLTNHMRTHTGEKPFSCPHCEKTFAYLNSLTIHTRLHTGETPFTCEVCNRGYKSSTSLKKHKLNMHYEINNDGESVEKSKTRKEGKKVECQVCHKMLYEHGFGTHMRVHLVVKKEFVCGICSKNFQKNSHLERHMRIHTGERPYPCVHCGKAFMQDNDLKRHVARHLGDKKFQCQHCGKQYYSKSALSVHVRAHAAAQLPKPPCRNCAAHSTACPHRASRADKTHLCTVCGKSFTTKSSLMVHTRLHTGDAPFRCPSCDKKYVTSTALKKHVMRIHTGEKSHACMICQQRYYDSFSLKRHVDRVHSILEMKRVKEEPVN